jgi:hypothetical protein
MNNNYPDLKIEQVKFTPLPEGIREEFATRQDIFASFMGIFPEINRF